MKKQYAYGWLVGILLAGSACGNMASQASEGPGAVSVETSEVVPVETSSSALEEETEPESGQRIAAEPGVYDVVVRLDVGDVEEGTGFDAGLLVSTSSDSEKGGGKARSGEASDGEPVPLPADRKSSSEGNARDGEPVPLPADRNSGSEDNAQDGEPVPLPADWKLASEDNTRDGEPVPLPAHWKTLLDTNDGSVNMSDDDSEESSTSSEDSQPGVETIRDGDSLTIVFTNLEVARDHLNADLSVVLSTSDWQTPVRVPVDSDDDE